MRLLRCQNELTLEVTSEQQTVRLGELIASLVSPSDVIALVGPLGAGKTRLCRAIAEALGVDPLAISSPTFVLIHEYEGRLPVFHFDAYRLENAAAFEDLGVADYWQAGGICLVEWADRVPELLPPESWWLAIEPTAETSRLIRITLPTGSQGTADALELALTQLGES